MYRAIIEVSRSLCNTVILEFNQIRHLQHIIIHGVRYSLGSKYNRSLSLLGNACITKSLMSTIQILSVSDSSLLFYWHIVPFHSCMPCQLEVLTFIDPITIQNDENTLENRKLTPIFPWNPWNNQTSIQFFPPYLRNNMNIGYLTNTPRVKKEVDFYKCMCDV